MLERTSRFTGNALRALQKKKLCEIVNFSLRRIPYYARNPEYPKSVSFDEIKSALKELPVIDKRIIQSNLNTLKSRPTWRGCKKTTGGSTGKPLVFYLDRFVTRQKERAFIHDQWRRIGYKPGDKVINLRGALPGKGRFFRHDKLFNTYVLSSLNLSLSTVFEYGSFINKIRPDFLHGYPSTIYQLVCLMEAKGLQLDYQPSGILCGSEKLFPYQREKIERFFKCRAFGWYGHSEYQVLAGECEHSHRLHVYPQYGYTELLPTGQRDLKGREIYEIIATGFNNHFMPLLRYRTQDYAVLPERQECTCGRKFMLLDEVLGREQEFVVDSHGNLISVTALVYGQHFGAFGEIESFQILQEKLGRITLFIKPICKGFSEYVPTMTGELENLLSGRMRVDVRLTDKIEKSPIGKSKTVIQTLNIAKYFSGVA